MLEPIQAGSQTVGSIRLAYEPDCEQELLPEEHDMLKTASAVLGQMIAQRADRDQTRYSGES